MNSKPTLVPDNDDDDIVLVPLSDGNEPSVNTPEARPPHPLLQEGRLKLLRVIPVLIVVTAVVAIAVALSGPGESSSGTGSCDSDVVQTSPNDDRSYCHAVLENGLQMILISDPTADKAAASLNVRAGAWDDPPTTPGLAHFTEHLLFMGTEKFPNESAYNEYLSAHAGRSNAWTSFADTNYYFEVDANFLDGALSRFSSFFVSPLFKEDAVDRERNAVNNEHEKNLNTDSRRYYELVKAVSLDESAFSKFSTGTIDTLSGPDIRQSVIDFYETFYGPSRMTVAILGKETLEQLEAFARPYFEEIPDRNVAERNSDYYVRPFDHTNRGIQISVKSISEIPVISLMWQVPSLEDYEAERVGDYLAYVLGYEGEGSVLQELRSRGWGDSLSVGTESYHELFSFVSVDVVVTSAGFEEADSVVAVVMDFLEMMRTVDPREHWDEMVTIEKIDFTYKEKSAPTTAVQDVSYNVQYRSPSSLFLPPAEAVYDEALVAKVLSNLTPHDLILLKASPSFNESSFPYTDPWYDIRYDVTQLSSTQKELWSEETDVAGTSLSMPAANDYISSDFTLVSDDEAEEVSSSRHNHLITLYYDTDTSFGTPKAELYALLHSSSVTTSPADVANALMIQKILTDGLSKYTYPASVAGLQFEFGLQDIGVELKFRGYKERLFDFVADVIENLDTAVEAVTEEQFSTMKGTIRQELESFPAMQPYRQAISYLDDLLVHGNYPVADILSRLENTTTASAVDLFRSVVHAYTAADVLAVGNLHAGHGKQFSEWIEHLKTSDSEDEPQGPTPSIPELSDLDVGNRTVYLGAGVNALYQSANANSLDGNSAVMSGYFVRTEEGGSLEERVLGDLLVSALHEKCFDQLRTQQQLGYIVACFTHDLPQLRSFSVVAQSSEYDSATLDERAEEFFDGMVSYVESMSEEIWSEVVGSVETNYEQKPISLTEKAGRYWREITYGDYLFNRVAEQVYVLHNISHDQFVSYYNTFVVDRDKRSKLSVHVFGADKEIRDPEGLAAASYTFTDLNALEA